MDLQVISQLGELSGTKMPPEKRAGDNGQLGEKWKSASDKSKMVDCGQTRHLNSAMDGSILLKFGRFYLTTPIHGLAILLE